MQNKENKRIVAGKYLLKICDGHFRQDTPENMHELIETATPKYFKGIDQYGFSWFAREDEGYEVWATVQENLLVNGGVHDTPRILEYDFATEHEIEIEIESNSSDHGKFDPLQSFCICYLFLEKQWIKNHDKNLGWMLSGLAILKNGLEIDPAFHRDFEECIQDVLQITSLDNSQFLTQKEVFQVLYKFLKMKFFDDSNNASIYKLLALLDYDNGAPLDPKLKNEWIECVETDTKRLIDTNHFFFKLKR
jgi:hypothetical protein